jgi:hypothetical protein
LWDWAAGISTGSSFALTVGAKTRKRFGSARMLQRINKSLKSVKNSR